MPRSIPSAPLRRVLACLAAWLWLLGVEVLPNLHIGLHGRLAPHSHEGDAGVAAHGHEGGHGHRHGHGHDGHGHDGHGHGHDARELARQERAFVAVVFDVEARDALAFAGPLRSDDVSRVIHQGADDARVDARRQAAFARLDPQHGRHALAHRGVAVLQPPPVLPDATIAVVHEVVHVDAAFASPPERTALRARARGPPLRA